MTVAPGSSSNGNASQWMDKEGNINCKRPVLFRKKEIHDSYSCGVVKPMKRKGDSKNNVEERKRFGDALVAYVCYNFLLRTLFLVPGIIYMLLSNRNAANRGIEKLISLHLLIINTWNLYIVFQD